MKLWRSMGFERIIALKEKENYSSILVNQVVNYTEFGNSNFYDASGVL